MKALVEEVNSVQRRIKVELSQEDVKSEFSNVYNRLRKKAKIKGFRPGKAPISIIKKFYGNSVAMDVADQLVKTHLFSAIKDESIQPIAAPVLETSELPTEGEAFSFSAVVDVLPKISIEGYKGLKIDAQPEDGDSEESTLERELEILQKRQAKTQDLTDPAAVAAEGMVATVSQKAQLDGEDFPPFSFAYAHVELGSGQLVQEIESHILGMKVGEEKSFTVAIPESFQDESFVGKEVSCVATLSELKEMILPEVNDDLAKDLGLEDLESLKANISERLHKQKEQNQRNAIEANILDQLSAKNEFEVPPSMVDQVIDSMFDEFQFPDDTSRQQAKKDPAKRAELKETAIQRTKNTLILSEVIKTEKIEVSDADLDEYVKEMLSSYGKTDEVDEKMMQSIKASMGNQARESLLFKKAIDFIIDHGELSGSTAQ